MDISSLAPNTGKKLNKIARNVCITCGTTLFLLFIIWAIVSDHELVGNLLWISTCIFPIATLVAFRWRTLGGTVIAVSSGISIFISLNAIHYYFIANFVESIGRVKPPLIIIVAWLMLSVALLVGGILHMVNGLNDRFNDR